MDMAIFDANLTVTEEQEWQGMPIVGHPMRNDRQVDVFQKTVFAFYRWPVFDVVDALNRSYCCHIKQ